MSSVFGPDLWSAGVPRRIRKPSPDITNRQKLAAAMAGGRQLVRTFTPTGPLFAVNGVKVATRVAETAIRGGGLSPRDAGLFTAATQSWAEVSDG